MLINEQKKESRKTREMKVLLPVDLHIRLHESKIIHGERICDVVTRALDAYFKSEIAARMPGEEAAHA